MTCDDLGDLDELLRDLRSSTQRAIAAIDKYLEHSAELEATQEEREAAIRAQVLNEFADIDREALRRLFGVQS